jgi:arylsulfatase A-like enzyme
MAREPVNIEHNTKGKTMLRREFIKAGMTASVGAGLQPKSGKAAASHPNILYVFSDQHRAASLPGEPYNQAAAPNIDAFRHANLSMDMCVSNYPLCTPHRGILMSGRYPAQTGIEANGIQLNISEYALTQAFHDAGYRVGYVGKWHLGGDREFVPPGPRRFGIDDWHIWGNTNDHYHAPTWDPKTGAKLVLHGWGPTLMTDQAIDFLKARVEDKGKQPWMLVMSWNPPHPPFNPPPEDQAPYAGQLKGRPNIKLPAAGGAAAVANEAELHTATQGYYGGITGVDKEFGRLLKMVDDLGLAEDTVVIYTSDHGEMLGSQGKMAKQMPWDESCRVPFAIRYPGVTPERTNSHTLFASIDIYLTLCGIAGVPVPKHCVGKNLSDVFRGKKIEKPEMVFLLNGPGDPNKVGVEDGDEEGGSHKGHGKGGGGLKGPSGELNATKYRGVRTETHTYAVTAQGRWLMYDNVADPFQMNNLANDPKQKGRMDAFDVKLREWIKFTGDKFSYPEKL